MVVTSSRAHAVRYKQEFGRYLAAEGLLTATQDAGVFSETVRLERGRRILRMGMNMGIKEKNSRAIRGREFQVLIVAEKYRRASTNRLMTHHVVDKRLADVQDVQRFCPA